MHDGDDRASRAGPSTRSPSRRPSRERMLELTVEIDGRPLSTWGCDGVVMATPTGSTAYAFSAGGPVVWPDVEALLLRADQRPRALRPAARRRPASSSSPSRWCPRTEGAGVVWCDGRRAVDLPPGARIEVHRSRRAGAARPPVAAAPFTDRLVEKFDLPVHGWRGAARRSVARR